MKCIGNEIKDVQYYGSGKAYGCADEHHKWLEIGKVYEITQITGQMYYDNTTGKTIDMLTVRYQTDDRIGMSNVPAILFRDLNKWRIYQIKKLLKWSK